VDAVGVDAACVLADGVGLVGVRFESQLGWWGWGEGGLGCGWGFGEHVGDGDGDVAGGFGACCCAGQALAGVVAGPSVHGQLQAQVVPVAGPQVGWDCAVGRVGHRRLCLWLRD